jgi:superfamily II DNA or RNA helicase
MPINSTDHRKIREDDDAEVLQEVRPQLAVGALVVVRAARWHIDASVAHADCCELHLSRAADGLRRVLLWPFDRPVAVVREPHLAVVGPRRWIREISLAAARTIDPGTPRARHSAADVLPYQLAPAIAMADGAARLFLADEVGLGKTIQAGWIIADLIEREPGARVLVAVPAGLRRQWSEELARFFAIAAVGVDARWLRDTVADIPADVSPWAAPGVYLVSIDFLKRPDVAAALRSHIWDLVAIDEAHTAAAPTERHAALSRIARRARRVVAISATPYSGDPAGFASLTALGQIGTAPPPLMFRRAREDTGDCRARRHRFAAVRISPAEARLQRLLERYSRDVWREAEDADAARLAVTILRKRALSSPAAAWRSLARRLELLRGLAPAPRQLSLFDEEDALDDAAPEAALAAPGLPDTARERRWLTLLIGAANAAVPHDSKERYVRRLVRRLRGEPIVIFTEYRDTLLQLARALPPTLHLHGGLSAGERAEAQRKFNTDGGLLLATDAAAEGLNLQQRCRTVLNFELPWNPARLEQRIGRIDRIGQRRTVHAITLVARDTAEDLVIANLARRLARVAAALGERDRLAAFLTDARTARIVIGGAPEVLDSPSDGLPPVNADPPVTQARTLSAAGQVRRAGRSSEPTSIFISSVRASRALQPGFVFAIRCAAHTVDGRVIAERMIPVHVALDVPRMSAAAAIRRAARLAISSLLDRAVDAVPDVDAWFTTVTHEHQTSVRSKIARETALAAVDETVGELQPGLFDRRVLRDASLASGEQLTIDHRHRVASLQREETVERTIAPAGVLVVWR